MNSSGEIGGLEGRERGRRVRKRKEVKRQEEREGERKLPHCIYMNKQTNRPTDRQTDRIHTLGVSSSNAILDFSIESRVSVGGFQGPYTGPGLALRHLIWPLVGFGEGGCHVIHIQDIHQHLQGNV